MTAQFQGAFRQSGATLFTGLIMLLLIMLLGISAIRMQSSHTQIIGNEQFNNEAEAAANFSLDQVMEDPNFTVTYATSTTIPAISTGQANYDVTIIPPACQRYRTIMQAELVTMVGGNPTILPQNQPCVQSQSLSSGLTLAMAGSSSVSSAGSTLCATTLWNVQATVVPSTTGATATLFEGISDRMDVPTALTYCP